nr:type II CAAX endopeptidase family protein [Lentibacillus sediminis]
MPSRYWWVILTYILMQLLSVIFAPVIYLLFPVEELQAQVYSMILSFLLATVVTLMLIRPDMKMQPMREAASTTMMVAWSILGVIMAFFAQGIASLIEIEVLGIQPGSENTQVIMDITRAAPIFMIVPAIFAPILEEILFRKIIFGRLYQRMNFFFAALLSAVIFALIHLDPLHLLVYTAMGFVFAFLYVQTKRIIVPIIVHMAMNTIVMIAQFGISPEELEQMRQQLEQQMIFLGG